MSRNIERVIYVDDCNTEGEGACKVVFMLDRLDISCCCHGRHLGINGISEAYIFPARAEVTIVDRYAMVTMMMEYTGKIGLADRAEFTIQVDDCVDEMIKIGWCLPCME